MIKMRTHRHNTDGQKHGKPEERFSDLPASVHIGITHACKNRQILPSGLENAVKGTSDQHEVQQSHHKRGQTADELRDQNKDCQCQYCKALCAGSPLIKEKMDLDIDVARLKVLKADHQSKQFRLEDQLLKYFPAEIERQQRF